MISSASHFAPQTWPADRRANQRTSNDAANHLDRGIPRDGRGDSADYAGARRLGGAMKNQQPRGFDRSQKAAEAGCKSGDVRQSKLAESAVGVDVPDVASHETA